MPLAMNSCSPSTVRLYVRALGKRSTRRTASWLTAIGPHLGSVVARPAAVPLESLRRDVRAAADLTSPLLWLEHVAPPPLRAIARTEGTNPPNGQRDKPGAALKAASILGSAQLGQSSRCSRLLSVRSRLAGLVHPVVLSPRHRLKVRDVVVARVAVAVMNHPASRDRPVVPLIDDAVRVPAADVLVPHTEAPSLTSPAATHWSPTSMGWSSVTVKLVSPQSSLTRSAGLPDEPAASTRLGPCRVRTTSPGRSVSIGRSPPGAAIMVPGMQHQAP